MTSLFDVMSTDQLIELVLMASEKEAKWQATMLNLERSGASIEAIAKVEKHLGDIRVFQFMVLAELEDRLGRM